MYAGRRYARSCPLCESVIAREVRDVSTPTSPEQHEQQDRDRTAERDVREYVKQLRSAPAEEIVAEAFFMLLNAAQIKLGRRDARLFIDLGAVMLEHARAYVSAELVKQVEQSLGQLRLAQVSAEDEVAKQAQPEPNDLPRTPTPPTASTAPPSAAQSPPSASKLWVPGR
jgi:hypothetical protein